MQNAQVQAPSSSSPTGRVAGARVGPSSMQTLSRLVKANAGGAGAGVRRLWTGYTALVARDLPFTAIEFPIFRGVQSRLWRMRGKEADGRQAPSSWLVSWVD